MITRNSSPPDYFVATTGDDSTGDGSINAPWKTIGKAIATVPIGGNKRIGVVAGTYAENVGGLKYLYLDRQFTDWVTVERFGPGTVTITDAASGTFCVRYAGGKRVRFQDVTIEQAGANSQAAVVFNNGAIADLVGCDIPNRNWSIFTIPTAAVEFALTRCNLHPRAGETGVCLGVYADGYNGGDIVAAINNCEVISQSPTGNSTGVLFRKLQAGAVRIQATITGGSYSNDNGYAICCDGGQLDIHGASVECAAAPALVLGTDGAATYTTTGSVSNCVIDSEASHSLLVGQGCSGVEVTQNTVNAGDHGIVNKGADSVITGNTVNPGTLAALLLKGCSGPTITGNTLRASLNNYACVMFSLEGSTKVSDVTLTGNTLEASGAADCLVWPGDTVDAGGGVCDSNIYDYSASSGNVGDVRATSGITTLSGLQGAWSGYAVTGNDANSTVID